jgi:hypothetical protein
MTARSTTLIMAASLALAPVLGLAQDRAVPRGGGDGGGGGGGSHPSPGVSSSSGGSSSSGSGYSGGSSSGSAYTPSTAERRHPRAGTGQGSSGGYYPGYPGYYPPYYPGYPGYGWGGGYYWGSWWPYGSYGWYGYPGWGFGWGGGGTVTHYVERESGSVRVLVDPSEARVYVDGYYAGTVDDFDGLFQRLNLSPGRHEIALKLEGYKTHRVRVYVAPDSTVKLHYDLEKGQGETFEDLAKDAPENEARREREQEERWAESEARAQEEQQAAVGGTLRLSVRPADASVYVDGAFRGSGREASALKLAPGKHRIEVVRPGYRTVEREVEIAPGEATEVTLELERPVV